MIKMQIILDDDKMRHEGKLDPSQAYQAIDNYLIGKLGLQKTDQSFYIGTGSTQDFSLFGLAFNTLRKKDWFTENVKTWLYFNSDSSENPEDFIVEDFKDYYQNHLRAIV